MKTKTLFILFIIFIVITSVGLYYWRELSLEKNKQLEELNDWSQNPPSFDFPDERLPDAKYISSQDWKVEIYNKEDDLPLGFKIVAGEVDCEETLLESSFPERVQKKIINNKLYCIRAFSEGAAGSVFTEYDYATVINDNLVVISFVARYPQCPNYPDPQRLECEQERETFNLDLVVDQIIQSA
jgi:hypothetical protein